MDPIENLPPAEKRKLLVRLLEKRLRKVAPAIAPGLPDPQIFDRFAIPVSELKPEVSLDPAIRFEAPAAKVTPDPANILLTGATGFLGAFLLHDFLNQTKGQVHCLIRCSDEDQGRKRIQKIMGNYFPDNGCDVSRITPISGDLSQPLFGLSARDFERLAATVDVVYHNAALVNGLYSYEQLKATNVLGTQEAIRLAASGKLKPLHYVSSISACPLEDTPEPKLVQERDLNDDNGLLYGGYPQSKWVAEQLIVLARSRGLPVCIYRPGIISGDSRTGVWSTTDATCKMIKVSVDSGITPDIDTAMDMTPVDYVSRALIYLSRTPESLGNIYHLANPKPLMAKHLISWIRSFGYPIRRIPYEAWRSEMVTLARDSNTNVLSSFAPLFSTNVSSKIPGWMANKLVQSQQSGVDRLISAIGSRYATQSVRLDCSNTTRDLAGTSIVCPEIDDRLLNTYFSYFIRIGFLNAPSH